MPMGHHVCTMDNFRGDNASDADAVTALVVVDAPGAPEGEGETASLRQIAVGTAKGTIRVGSHRLCLVAPTNGAISSCDDYCCCNRPAQLHDAVSGKLVEHQPCTKSRMGYKGTEPLHKEGHPILALKTGVPQPRSCLCGANCSLVLTPL